MQQVIDFHIHIFPDKIAEKTIDFLTEKSTIKPVLYTNLKNTIAYLKKHNIFSAVNMPIATKADQVLKINRFITTLGDIFTFGAIHPEMESFDKEIEYLKNHNIKGVKLHPEYMAFYPDESRYDKMYQTLSDAGLYVMFHAGKDIGFKDYHSSPDTFIHLKDKFPDLKLILAHFGSWKMWNKVLDTIIGKDFYIDTALSYDFDNDDIFSHILKNHRQDRILFGSDLPWQDPIYIRDKILSLDLEKSRLEDIFYNNAARILQIS